MDDNTAIIVVCSIAAIVGIIDRWIVRRGRK